MGRRGPKPRDTEARFLDLIKVDPVTGCWIWQGRLNNGGYGMFYARPGKVMSAHRWAYMHWQGPVPAGQEVEHRCHSADLTCPGGPTCPHRPCVKALADEFGPAHLESVTHSVNLLRGVRTARAKTPAAELARRRARYRIRKGLA